MNYISPTLNNPYRNNIPASHDKKKYEQMHPILKNQVPDISKDSSNHTTNSLPDIIKDNSMAIFASLGGALLLSHLLKEKKPPVKQTIPPIAELINTITPPILAMIATLGVGLRFAREDPEIKLLKTKLEAAQKSAHL